MVCDDGIDRSHPALRAASPQASPSDYFIGDDFFHFGAFRLSPSAELPYLFDFDPKKNSRFPYDQVDTYEFFLDLGTLSNMNERYLHGVSPTWNHFMEHTTYDGYWKTGNTLQHLTEVKVPTLNVVGWWDAENLGGALDIYDQLEKQDRQGLNRIVVGPWSHGQWARGPGDHLGEYDFQSDTVGYYQREIEVPFFAHHLKGAEDPRLEEATMFQTGSNLWKSYPTWPPKDNHRTQKWYLRANGTLRTEQATNTILRMPSIDRTQPNQFPIPNALSWDFGAAWMRPRIRDLIEPVSFGRSKINALSAIAPMFCSLLANLSRKMSSYPVVSPPISMHLKGTDADWVVKVIDVYPEKYPEKPEMGGYQLMIADDVLRGRFRKSFENRYR